MARAITRKTFNIGLKSLEAAIAVDREAKAVLEA